MVQAVLLLVSGWRWRRLLVTQDVHASTWQLTISCLVANFFNNFLPSNIGGDVVRIADTAGLTGSRTVATAVVLLDRVLGLIALFAVAACGSLMLRHALPGHRLPLDPAGAGRRRRGHRRVAARAGAPPAPAARRASARTG